MNFQEISRIFRLGFDQAALEDGASAGQVPRLGADRQMEFGDADGGSLPDWWTVDSTPGSESITFEPTGDAAVPAQLRWIAGAGSEADGTEVAQIEGDEGSRLFGLDGWGQIGSDVYEHAPSSAGHVFNAHSQSGEQLSLFEISTGHEGTSPLSNSAGGAKMRASSVSTPARISSLDDDVVRVEFDGKLGFFGHAPVARPAAPTTIEDVIAALKTLGLVAT